MIHGVDVSKFQPGTDWAVVQGLQFAIIKATEGLHWENPFFNHDWTGTKAHGVLRSGYHFFRPNVDAKEQADHFIKKIGPLAVGDLPAVLDWEVSDRVSPKDQKLAARKWLAVVEESTKLAPFLYSYPAYFQALGDMSEFKNYPLYIAHPGVSHPHIPSPWSYWTFWQTDFHGHVKGIKTEVDLDVFNGTIDQLKKFTLR